MYRYVPASADSSGPELTIATPPAYVSADHLHVGHAMSYSQPDYVVRYRRMRGERVSYPMGFDDNGLPTERYVEQAHAKLGKQSSAADLLRAEFVALCLAEAFGAYDYAQAGPIRDQPHSGHSEHSGRA